MRHTLSFLLVAMLTLVGCSGSSDGTGGGGGSAGGGGSVAGGGGQTGDAGPAELDGFVDLDADALRFAVISGDFTSVAIGFADAEGNPINRNWLNSGSVEPGLTTVLSGDVVLPSEDLGDGAITLIDRFGADTITRIDVANSEVLGQVRASGGEFASNPHDIVYLSDTLAWVTRHSANLDPEAPANDLGNDIVGFNPTTFERTDDIIDLSAYNAEITVMGDEGPEDVTAYARPSRARMVGDFVVVGLVRASDGFSGYAEGLVLIIDPSDESIIPLPLAGFGNCGTILPVPGNDDAFAVGCRGAFGTDFSAGALVFELDAEGDATELARYRQLAEEEGTGNVAGNFAMLSETTMIGVVQGAWESTDAPDVVYYVDLDAGTRTEVFRTMRGFDIFGNITVDADNAIAIAPDRLQGLWRIDITETGLANATLIDFTTSGLAPTSTRLF